VRPGTLPLARRVRAVKKGVTSNFSSPGRRLTRSERILLGRLHSGQQFYWGERKTRKSLQVLAAKSECDSVIPNFTVPEPSTVLLALSVSSPPGDSIRE